MGGVGVMIWLAIVVSAILYRMPRGGGLGVGKSTEGVLIWAGVSAGIFCAALSVPWWFAPIVAALLMLGEAPGWSQWWPGAARASLLRLSLRGLLLLNPLMGPIYFGCHRYRSRLPVWGKFLDGWTSYAELMCGFVTACSYVFMTWLIALWFF